MVGLFLFCIFTLLNKNIYIMKVSAFLSQSLEEVKNFSEQLFNALVEDNGEFNFLNQVLKNNIPNNNGKIKHLTETGELHSLPTLDFRDSETGDVYDAHVCVVTKKGLYVITTKDEICKDVELDDLASIEDTLILLNEMENYLL